MKKAAVGQEKEDYGYQERKRKREIGKTQRKKGRTHCLGGENHWPIGKIDCLKSRLTWFDFFLPPDPSISLKTAFHTLLCVCGGLDSIDWLCICIITSVRRREGKEGQSEMMITSRAAFTWYIYNVVGLSINVPVGHYHQKHRPGLLQEQVLIPPVGAWNGWRSCMIRSFLFLIPNAKSKTM